MTTRIKRALLSVSDKSGLVDLARALAGHGVELVSTGGTARAIAGAGLAVREVADLTGFPEMMEGRLKTLHPMVHGGLLARRDKPDHLAAMAAHGIPAIDLAVVNLYPFEDTVAGGADFAEIIENIDIGGPAMTRSAAKNHGDVTVIVDPQDYGALIEQMAANAGGTTADFRAAMAARAFARTAAYDAAISGWFAGHLGDGTPRRFALGGTLKGTLRYGENPHQTAGFYGSGEARPGVASARQVQGKALSYNNINDTDAAYECIAELGGDRPAIAIIKHANPCGVALGDSLEAAYASALKCDPVSAFGGIIAANRPLDAAAADAITRVFTEVVIAPGASPQALEIFAAKTNLRLLLTEGLPDPAASGMTLKTVAGGFLMQSRDNGHITADDLKIVTKRQPTDQEMADLLFAFRVGKHVKSNTIVYAKHGATVGIGAGQMSRIDSARIAAWKAREAAEAAGEDAPLTEGSVAASDAFFPFADGLEVVAAAGATAVIQPGGSMRDDQVIAAADAAGLAMVLTGMRHFRH